ncbi:MAG TPA: putative sugar nucleotidyl transferase [Longimicrobiales bacterium]|nr:putative sugar nucleotidyl transferase [Longimicrobiales bacterium]
MDFALYLYDDEIARSWQPFALTRPIGELLLGAYTFRARAERVFGMRCIGQIAAPHLLGFDEREAAPVIGADHVKTTVPRLFLNSRAVLDWGTRFAAPSVATTLHVGGETVGWFVPAGEPNPSFDGAPADGEVLDMSGRVLRRVWDLIAWNPAQIERDYTAARPRDGVEEVERGGQFQAIGYRAGVLRLGAGVSIEPNVVLDFTHGPIWLEDGVTVRSFTRLAGPAYIGQRTTLLGGPFEILSAGPRCRLHGEIEESIVLGYSNKAHDGFLGHAYLGRWVNLGALTTNSDLKNNYGTIRIWSPDGAVDTGLIKLGCLLGDHVKTGIGALLNTGTVVGAGSNLFGTELPPKYVPPFSWGGAADLTAFDIDRFMHVAEVVMQRRDVALSAGMRAVLRAAWQLGRAAERQ